MIVVLLVAGGLVAVGYWWGRLRSPREPIQTALLAEHRRLLTEAREAHFRGDLAVADSLEAAADRVWKEQTR